MRACGRAQHTWGAELTPRICVDDDASVPPPPKPTASGTPAEEAERLGREHSNKRELKMRQERARALAEESNPPPLQRSRPIPVASGNTGVPGVAGAPVVQPRKVVTPAGAGESKVPDADDRPPRTPHAPRAAERDRGRADRPKSVAKPPSAPPAPPAPLAEPALGHASSVIDEVAVEAEELIREGGVVWGRFTPADKITFICALLTGLGTLMPWLHRKNEEVVIGLGCGGIVHGIIAVVAIALLVRRELPGVDERGLRPTPHQQRRSARRTALLMLLLALVSTVAGTWFLLLYGAVRRFEVAELDVSVGLYVTLAAGLGLSYSGFAFFWHGVGRRD